MPTSDVVEKLVEEWRVIAARYSGTIHDHVLHLVRDRKSELASSFYSRMMADSAAEFFLSNELVHSRLHDAMQGWLVDVFSAAVSGEYQAAVRRQQEIGEIHARIGIPAYLVMRGSRRLDVDIFERLAGISLTDRIACAEYVSEVMGFAIEIMCHSYAISHERNARSAESYRLFAAAQDIGAEKDRQRAALLDWENELMYAIASGEKRNRLPALSKSDFGLWLTHKGVHVFEGSNEVYAIVAQLSTVDEVVLRISHEDDAARRIELLRDIRDQTRTIDFLLNALFEAADHIESGRDALTRLLSRRYLQVVMSREIDFARKNATPLCALTIDADSFKEINDTFGHDAGDAALQQLALSFSQCVRASDYVFRLGGEEFLVVLVDTDLAHAIEIAENLRRRVASHPVATAHGQSFQVTVSIGVAAHDGHPDYLKLLKSSDDALFRAKESGRNRVLVSAT
ncbi:diguanylate cyclase [Paraburkholderia unamae]|nr:diguanylate cyclase [Paraburkholderia unamae]